MVEYAVEQTLILIKPDAMERGLCGTIISRLDARGWKIKAMKLVHPTREQAEEHYRYHRDMPFFDELVSFLCSGSLVAICLEGERVISLSRRLIGNYKLLECAPGTIRGDLAESQMRNLIHGSDDQQAASRELGIWFTPQELART